MLRSLVAVLVGMGGLLTGCVPAPVRVMSYNIRYANPDDGANRWELRREAVVERIKAFEPDMLGVQEALYEQVEFLRQNLPGYATIGVGRDDGNKAGEFGPILYRKRTFQLDGYGYFWLSNTPDRPGSVGWDAALPRMVTWVRLRFRRNPVVRVTVLNTHLDHRGERARLESARIIRRWAEANGGKPLIVMGDFNADPDSEVHRILTEPTGNLGELRDAYAWLGLSEAEGGTFNDFGASATGPRIDWILFSRRFEPVAAGIDRTLTGDRPPSDHFPVTAVLRLVPITPTGAM